MQLDNRLEKHNVGGGGRIKETEERRGRETQTTGGLGQCRADNVGQTKMMNRKDEKPTVECDRGTWSISMKLALSFLSTRYKRIPIVLRTWLEQQQGWLRQMNPFSLNFQI